MKKILLLILFIPILSLADEIITKNGRRYRGEIVSQDERKMRLNLGCGQFAVIRTSDITSHTQEPLSATLLYLGQREVSRNQVFHGTRTLLRAYELAPNNIEIKAALAKAQVQLAGNELEKKRPNYARRLLVNALNLFPKDKSMQNFLKSLDEKIASYDALEKKARSLHVQGKWLEAYHTFKKLLRFDLSRGPSIRRPFAEVIVALGDKELLDQQWTIAKNYYNEALVQEPDIINWIEERWVTSHLEPIWEHLQRGNYEVALEEISYVLKVTPENINALYYRGIALLQLDDQEKARRDFEQILSQENDLNFPQDIYDLQKAAKKYYKTSFELLPIAEVEKRWEQSLPGDWKEVTGKGWILHHHSDWIARQLEFVIDDSIERITKDLTGRNQLAELAPPVHIYIYRNEKDYLEASKMTGWTAGVTRIKQVNRSVKSRQILSYQTAPQLVRGTIPHELTHILLPLFLDNQQNIPHWLNEGVATRFEPDFKKSFYKNLVDQYRAAGSTIDLDTLVKMESYPNEEEQVKLFYAQSYLLVDYLISTKGSQEFLTWSKGVTSHNALERLEQWIGPTDSFEQSLFGK